MKDRYDEQIAHPANACMFRNYCREAGKREAALRAGLENARNHLRVECDNVDDLLREVERLKAESYLRLESANSMRAAWNAACAEISVLKAKLGDVAGRRIS